MIKNKRKKYRNRISAEYYYDERETLRTKKIIFLTYQSRLCSPQLYYNLSCSIIFI